MRSGTGEILTKLRELGATPRAELSRLTGISSAGVTKITAQLMTQGILREASAGDHAHSVGRPPVMVDIERRSRHVLGIHMGAGAVHVAMSDAGLRLGKSRRTDIDLGDPVDHLIERVVVLARDVMAESKIPARQILGIGVGVPGSVDRNHRVNTLSILAGWRNVPFADAFEEALGLPVVIDHNATAIAMAEACYGAGRDAESILYLLLGKGIGGGFAQIGSLERRSAVELGHIVVEPGGLPCRCGGQGCLERFFSEEPLRRLIGSRDVINTDLIGAAMNSPEWPRVFEYLVQVLATTITLMGPKRVVLGGDLNEAPDSFLEALRAELPDRVMPQQREDLCIERTSLAEPVGVQGAAAVALEEFLYTTGPGSIPRLARASMRV